MPRDNFDLRRVKPKFSPPNKIVIYCEGRNTEPSYLELLKPKCSKVIPVPKPGRGGHYAVDIVSSAIGQFEHLSPKEKNKYSQKWLMFDYDGRPDYSTAIKMARDNGFQVAFSSMCIEYWFLLHFESHNGDAIPLKGNSHSQAIIDKINEHIKKYNKKQDVKNVPYYDKNSKEVTESFFELMLSIDTDVTHKRRIENAFNSALKMHQMKKDNGQEFAESVTTVYQLLIELGLFTKKETFQNFDVKRDKQDKPYYTNNDGKVNYIKNINEIITEYVYNAS